MISNEALQYLFLWFKSKNPIKIRYKPDIKKSEEDSKKVWTIPYGYISLSNHLAKLQEKRFEAIKLKFFLRLHNSCPVCRTTLSAEGHRGNNTSGAGSPALLFATEFGDCESTIKKMFSSFLLARHRILPLIYRRPTISMPTLWIDSERFSFRSHSHIRIFNHLSFN